MAARTLDVEAALYPSGQLYGVNATGSGPSEAPWSSSLPQFQHAIMRWSPLLGEGPPIGLGDSALERSGGFIPQPRLPQNGGGNGGCEVDCTPCDAKCQRTCTNSCTGRSTTAKCCLSGFVCQNGRCACPNPSVCPAPPNSTANCINGTCGFTCNPGYTQCGNSCADLGLDPANCGSCGNSCGSGTCCFGNCCPSGTYCSEGMCCPLGTFGCADKSCCPAGQCCNDGRCNCNGICCTASQACAAGECVATPFCPQPLPPPGDQPPGETGNSNYIFVDSACGNISDLAVSVTLTQDLLPSDFFSVQLNTYAPPGLAVGAMQYTINTGGEINDDWVFFGNYEGWACNSSGSCNEIFGTPNWLGWSAANMGNLPTGEPLHAGTMFGITLNTDSPTGPGPVTSVTFTWGPDAVNTFPSVTVPIPPSQQFPVVGFQVNIVGDYNGNSVTFASAAGNIEYSVPSGTLCSLTNPGNSCSSPNFGIFTVENSNIQYLPVTSCCGTAISQAFKSP